MDPDHRERSHPILYEARNVQQSSVPHVDATYHPPRLVQRLGSPSCQQRRVTISSTNEGMSECPFAAVLEMQREAQL